MSMLRITGLFSLNFVMQPLNKKKLFAKLHTFAKLGLSHHSREPRNAILKLLYIFLLFWSAVEWITMGLQSRSFQFFIRITTSTFSYCCNNDNWICNEI